MQADQCITEIETINDQQLQELKQTFTQLQQDYTHLQKQFHQSEETRVGEQSAKEKFEKKLVNEQQQLQAANNDLNDKNRYIPECEKQMAIRVDHNSRSQISYQLLKTKLNYYDKKNQSCKVMLTNLDISLLREHPFHY